MNTRFLSHARQSERRVGRTLALVSALGLALMAPGSVAHGASLRSTPATGTPSGCATSANENVGGFAIDGQLQRQCSDAFGWADGPGGAGVVQATRNADGTCGNTGARGAVVLCDGVKQADQSVFAGGNKEADPCSWGIHAAPPPPDKKDDISNAYVYGTHAANGAVYMYGGLEFLGRTNNPSTDYDMELNQSAPNGIPDRKPGDVLLSVDFNGTNSPFTVKAWVAKTPAQDANVTPCGTQTANYDFAHPDFTAQGNGALALGSDITAAVNTNTIACGSWQCYDEKYNLVNTLPQNNFTEAAFNLTNLLQGTGVNPCGTFAISFRSRASGDSSSSQLKDSVGPQAYSPCRSNPTAAHVSRFSAARHGGSMTFHWNTAIRTGIAGFAVYAGSHRLNAQPIPVHQAHAYTYRSRWTGHGPYALRILMTNGTQRSISA
ncbi:MAG: hypothetical protein M3Z66_12800 [Chloroflexota bacterium]|nr:hypothetical protein [Chloroflexota bacterium]